MTLSGRFANGDRMLRLAVAKGATALRANVHRNDVGEQLCGSGIFRLGRYRLIAGLPLRMLPVAGRGLDGLLLLICHG